MKRFAVLFSTGRFESAIALVDANSPTQALEDFIAQWGEEVRPHGVARIDAIGTASSAVVAEVERVTPRFEIKGA